jgi:hypothetical protein
MTISKTMKGKEKLRERFLRDPLPHCLAGLAATLGRISSSARNSNDPTIVANLLDEARHLIEWTAAEFEPARIQATDFALRAGKGMIG